MKYYEKLVRFLKRNKCLVTGHMDRPSYKGGTIIHLQDQGDTSFKILVMGLAAQVERKERGEEGYTLLPMERSFKKVLANLKTLGYKPAEDTMETAAYVKVRIVVEHPVTMDPEKAVQDAVSEADYEFNSGDAPNRIIRTEIYETEVV